MVTIMSKTSNSRANTSLTVDPSFVHGETQGLPTNPRKIKAEDISVLDED